MATLAVAVAAGCGGPQDVAPPPLEEAEVSLDGFTVTSAADEVGTWEGRGSDGRVLVRVGLTEWRVIEDLDQDGTTDALAVLWTSGGGSGTFMELASFRLEPGDGTDARWVRSGAITLGDRVRVRAMNLSGTLVELHLTEHGPSDPMCCPTVERVREFRLNDGVLAAEAGTAGV